MGAAAGFVFNWFADVSVSIQLCRSIVCLDDSVVSIILVTEVDVCHDFAVSFETRCYLQDSNWCANHCFAICQCHRFGAFVAHGQFRTRVLRLSFSLFSEQWLLSLLPCPLLSFKFQKFKDAPVAEVIRRDCGRPGGSPSRWRTSNWRKHRRAPAVYYTTPTPLASTAPM